MRPTLSVFIDEAGDPGVRDGLQFSASRHEWLCVSACIVRSTRDAELVDWVKEMRGAANSRQSGALHYHRITPERRAGVCACLATKPIKGLVLASHKTNMREYINPRIGKMLAGGTFYNWCLRLLLERVTAWCEAWQKEHLGQVEPVEIMFARRGHDYEHFFAYVDRLRMQAETGTLFLKGPGLNHILLDRTAWTVRAAEERAGLQTADVVASAFYQAANSAAPTFNEDPARALSQMMVRDGKGNYANVGVTVWPLPNQAPLPEASRSIFRFYGYGW